MEKASRYTLSFLLVATLLVPTAAAKSASDVAEGTSTLAEDQLLVDESAILKEKDKIQEFLKEDGNSVTVYGIGLNKEQVYDLFLQDKHVPKFTKLSSEVKIKREGKEVAPPDPVEHHDVYGPEGEKMTAVSENSETISTDITIINRDGEYYIIDGEVTLPAKSKKTFTKDKLHNILNKDMKSKEISDFKSRINSQESQLTPVSLAASTTPSTVLTSIRKSNWFYDDSLYYELDTFEIATSITDYTIYKSDDQDSSYDYLTIDAKTTWYPAYDNRDIINGIQGTIDNYWTSDSLIDYYPNTGSLDSQLQNNSTYQIGIGYPFAATFNATWNSGATVKLQAKGDRSTGRYYQFFYGTDWGIFNWIGSGDPVDSQYTATYKSSGSDLGVYVYSSVRHQWFNESTSKWKDNSDILTYDY